MVSPFRLPGDISNTEPGRDALLTVPATITTAAPFATSLFFRVVFVVVVAIVPGLGSRPYARGFSTSPLFPFSFSFGARQDHDWGEGPL